MIYDPFQKKAIAAIDEEKSVLVSAPTGAGKTAIAEYAIVKALSRDERVIYTAPIKALSNQKYRDFSVRYPDKVGLLTGDVSLNADAPIVIMTTEIYRNQLFEDPERLKNTAWVIFDEVHYLDDVERGTVWEEAIMFSPEHIRFVALSATAPNVEELAQWIRGILNHPIDVIIETHRPVPLVHLFQCQGKVYDDPRDLRKDGYLGRDIWPSLFGGGNFGRRDRFSKRGHERSLRARPNRTDDLIRHLVQEKRLPCLYFCFGRKRAEELAWEQGKFDFLDPEEKKEIEALYQKLCERFDLVHEASAADLKRIILNGIAFHHAGMLPTLKEVIEQLFTSKLIKLIFTTETFALGINMPAKTVVFDELRKFYGTHFANLRTRDYFQMAGRAGRRGMDSAGFVYSRINPHQIPFPAVNRIMY
ncbi:MAG: DEAD/DEAH box helicase, partial [Candidatus Omnitrophota bacterium]